MNDQRSTTHWKHKFGNALRGIKRGVRGESSFFVHFFVAVCVVVSAVVFQLPLARWCLLILCIGSVLVAEMFNTALERFAKACTDEQNADIRDALDMASGAVLLASISAVVVGALIFVPHLVALF